jgi:hypothetical protein
MGKVALGVLLSCLLGCETSQEARDDAACTIVCRCFASPLPSMQEQCIAECIMDIAPVDDRCKSCIDEHANACSTLEADCDPLC